LKKENDNEMKKRKGAAAAAVKEMEYTRENE
jgi:hypothetical protein